MQKNVFIYLVGLVIAFSPAVYAWGLGDIVGGVADGVNKVVSEVNGNDSKENSSKSTAKNAKVPEKPISNILILSDDSEIINNLAIAGLKDNISKVDKSAVGRWALVKTKKKKYKQVRMDEFELDSAIEESYVEFIDSINKYQYYIGKTSTLVVGAKFGKYDFKKEGFPINILGKNAFIEYHGKGAHIVPNSRGSGDYFKLKFDNINSKNTFLPMKKAIAKEFIKNSKDGSGRVHRKLRTRYTYIIKKVSTPITNIKSCNKDFHNCKALGDVVLTAHIIKMEIYGTNRKTLHTYNYK